MSMYNLIEYIDHYWDTSGSLWKIKRNESSVTDDVNPDNVAIDNSSYFKYKSSFSGESAAVIIVQHLKV